MNQDSSAPPEAKTAWRGRALWLGVLLLALLVHAPSLRMGYMADDFGLQLVLDGRLESASWKPWSLYDFGSFAAGILIG